MVETVVGFPKMRGAVSRVKEGARQQNRKYSLY